MHESGVEMRTAKDLLVSNSNKCFLVITLLHCEHLPYTAGVIRGHGAPQLTEIKKKIQGNLVHNFKAKPKDEKTPLALK